MKVIQKIVELQNELFSCRKENKTIGLVPTMGALHDGHASLVKQSVKENDITVVSERYPRTLEADCKLIEACGADYVFAPSVEEVYPKPDNRQYEFPPQSTVMEGAKRPGHFNGVCQVVSRLFYIVHPDKAYFGEKDWQQIAVIKRLVDFIGMKDEITIVECPIIRDADGLAMSSRNMLLTADERAIAPKIYEALSQSVAFSKTHTVAETREKVIADINAVDGLEVEYFEIVDGNTLLEVNTWEAYVVGCITVYCGHTPIRLIDHIKYRG